MQIFTFEFMQNAFIVGLLLAVAAPCVGTTVVLRRLSMIGDAISHASLAGVAAGLLLGINPVAGATAACIAAALCVETIRRKLPKRAEVAIAIVTSAGIGLAALLSGGVKGGTSFNSFLFGSIVLISKAELIGVAAVSLAVIVVFLLLYRPLFYLAFDERAARLAGIRVGAVNFLFTILTALTVAVASRTVGALIVSSLMVVPVATAMQIAKSYRQTVLFAIATGVCCMIGGLFLSFYAGLRPGGSVALLGVLAFVLATLYKKFFK